jgi:hypothetical protein
MDLTPHQFSEIIVRSKQNGSTPGFRTLFHVDPNSHYLIDIVGKRDCDVQVRLWIGTPHLKTLLFSEKYELGKEDTVLSCPIYTDELNLLYVGLLFMKDRKNAEPEEFSISRFAITKTTPGHPSEIKLNANSMVVTPIVSEDINVDGCRSYGMQKLIPSNRTYITEINCKKGEMLSAILQSSIEFKRYTGYCFEDGTLVHNRKTFDDPRCFFYKKSLIDYTAWRDDMPTAANFCYGFLGYIEKDREFLSHLPKGMLLLFSVPKECPKNPIRTFKTAKDVQDRYGFAVVFREITEIQRKEAKRFHCIGDII